MMADEKKKENWLPWIVAALAVFAMLRNQQPQPDRSQPKELNSVVSQTLPSIRSAYKQAFLEAASKIESGEIKDQEQWTKFIADNAGAKQREALDRVYEAIDKLDLPASFAGKESEIAKINREIAGAW
jgi:thiamine biosynthesis lipoprotein ApbE